MIATDRDALVCDMAETYGLYDLWSLPVDTVATLACGLRDDSRIKLKLSGLATDTKTILLASAVDRLSILVWAQTEDGQKNRNRPESIVEAITGQEQAKPVEGFDSVEEFEAARKRILEGCE